MDKTAIPDASEIVRELHESSQALLSALRERSPMFLEHLERRERALLGLKNLPAGIRDFQLLQASAVAGEAAAVEAQHMRQEALETLQRLQSQHLLSRGLSAGTAPLNSALDLSA